jgi:hypothetical protein
MVRQREVRGVVELIAVAGLLLEEYRAPDRARRPALGRIGGIRDVVHVRVAILETEIVHDPGGEDRRGLRENRVRRAFLRAPGAVSGRAAEAAEGAEILIQHAHHQRVSGGQLMIEPARDEVPLVARRKRAVVYRQRGRRGNGDRQGPVFVDELVGAEVVRLVEREGAADRAAGALLVELRFRFLEVVARLQARIAEESKCGSIELIRARFGDHVEHGLERLAMLRVEAVRDDLELLDAVLHEALHRCSPHVIVDVTSVDDRRVVVAGVGAADLQRLGPGNRCVAPGAGDESRQREKVARQERQLLDLLFFDGGGHVGSLSVHQRGLPHDGQRLF